MTRLPQPSEPDKIPEKINAVAAAWIARRDVGFTPAEQAEFDCWRTRDPRHLAALTRFECTWSTLAEPGRTGKSKTIFRRLEEIGRRQRRRRIGMTGATLALFLVVGLASRTWWKSILVASSPNSNVVVMMPEHRSLPDGSTIDLSAGAEVSVNYLDALRRVTLKHGTAYFTVAKNRLRPFVVSADRLEVRAVGTAFSVQVDARDIDVLVTEGRVAVDRPAPAGIGPPPSRTLAVVPAGNHVVVDPLQTYAPTTPPRILPVSAEDIAARLAWRDPRVEFSGAPLKDVIAFVNRYNRGRFVLVDRGLASIPVSGLFDATDTDTFVRMLEAGFGVRAERRSEGEILLHKAP